jgi:hypothetical protein
MNKRLEPSSFDHCEGLVVAFGVNDAVIILENKVSGLVFESNAYARAESVLAQILFESIERACGWIRLVFGKVVCHDLAANRSMA